MPFRETDPLVRPARLKHIRLKYETGEGKGEISVRRHQVRSVRLQLPTTAPHGGGLQISTPRGCARTEPPGAAAVTGHAVIFDLRGGRAGAGPYGPRTQSPIKKSPALRSASRCCSYASP